jgi:hypothetical protein
LVGFRPQSGKSRSTPRVPEFAVIGPIFWLFDDDNWIEIAWLSQADGLDFGGVDFRFADGRSKIPCSVRKSQPNSACDVPKTQFESRFVNDFAGETWHRNRNFSARPPVAVRGAYLETY